jgi:hypothetical protein
VVSPQRSEIVKKDVKLLLRISGKRKIAFTTLIHSIKKVVSLHIKESNQILINSKWYG